MPSLTNSIVYRVTVSGGITYVYVQSLNMIGEGPFYGGTILSTSAIATLVYTQETETNSDHVESDAWAAVGLEPPLTWSVLVSGQIHEYTPEDEVTTSSPGFSGDGVLELSPNTDPGGDIDPPTNLSQTSATTTTVDVSWTAVTGATGYSFTIVGKTAPADTSVNNVVFTGLTPGTSYIITVTAKNTAGSSISSDNFTITANNNINDIPCFKEDTKILTDKGYRPIKDLRKGDMVKTIKEGFRPIKLIGYMPFQNNPSHERLRNQLYIYQKNNIPELTEDLVLTGGHCVLVRNFVGDQQQMVNNTFGNIFLTEGYYRLPSYFDERSDIYQTAGPFNVYHLCLDGIDDSLNHGIYANGFLVESSFTVELKKRKWTLL